MNRQAFLDRIKAAADAIQAFFDKADADERALTVEEQAQVAELETQHKAAEAELERFDAAQKTRQQIADSLKKVERESSTRKTTPGAVRHDDHGRVTATMEATDEEVTINFGESRDAQIRKSYQQTRKDCNKQLRAAGYAPWGEFGSFSDFCRAGFEGGHRFDTRYQKHFAAVQGMSEGIGADGGYTVLPEFAGGIIDRVYSNDLWGRTDNYTVAGNNLTFLANAETSRANGSRHGGLRGYWLAEGGTFTSSKPTLREVSLKLVKLGVLVYLTEELISDSGVALQQYVARKAAEEFNFMIGDSLVNGTGVGQPKGILTAECLLSVAAEAGQLATTLQTENIVKMYSRFYAPNMGSAVWLHNQDIGPELHLMTLGVGTGGVVTYMPPGGLSSSPYASLMGRPMVPTEFNATLGTQGDIILADLGQILSISKGGIAQAVSMHVQFLTDQLALRFVMRLNAQPWETAAITPYKGSNTQSSFIVLDTRS